MTQTEALRLTRKQAKEVRDALIFWQAHDMKRLKNPELDDIIIGIEDIIERRLSPASPPVGETRISDEEYARTG